MKFLTLMISVALLGCGLPLYGQQAGRAFRTLPSPCLGRPGLPPGVATALCKPALGGAQPQQASNDIVRNDDSGTFITFDVPGAVNLTVPVSINPPGAITGFYTDASFVFHGFLRAHDGNITTFDAPDAVNGTLAGSGNFGGPAINPAGAITGTYFDASFVGHGFLRSPDGTLTTFDVPGAVNGTSGQAINAAGGVMGFYTDASFVVHGFLRSPDGTLTTFDPPGSTSTVAFGLNPKGAVTGQFFDANGVHGFLRARDGTFATFDPAASRYTNPVAINPAGAITGTYFDASNVDHGFLRANDGSITAFDAPGAGTGTFQGTSATGINAAGAISGVYIDAGSVVHGFLRSPEGTITALDVPGSTSTAAYAINPAGVITGVFSDASGTHGFLRIP